MMKTFASCNSITTTTTLHQNPSHIFQPLPFNPISRLAIPKQKDGIEVPGDYKQRLCFLSTSQRAPIARYILQPIYASVGPGGVPLPSRPPPNPWRNWLVGMVMTVILPFFTYRFGPLMKLKQDIHNVIETAEHIAKAIEVVAEKVDKVAEEISDDLPEGAKLRKSLDFIEDVAEKVDKRAEEAGDFIDKVQEMEEKLGEIIEPVFEEAKEVAKKTNAQEIDKTKL